MSDYRPSLSEEDAARIRGWHDAAYASMRSAPEETVDYLGLSIVVPPGVFPPTAVADLLGNAVLAEVRDTDRVLDMGTGSGVNAILAASRSTDVLAVDLNPTAVAAATANAARNGVADRVTVLESDVFDAVSGRFDLMVFDPPFRWFAPRDLLEASIADENYGAMTRFVRSAGDFLAPGGRILMFFGTSGDLDYLYRLIDENGLSRTIVASRELVKPEMTVQYHTLRLERDVGR
ncbi:methyltransferase [Actinophytocola sp.]|uniref:methyltransferase n=1 Tax=Actinophytocola sp. TaxID=1872138 RepID=UPI002ED05669